MGVKSSSKRSSGWRVCANSSMMRRVRWGSFRSWEAFRLLQADNVGYERLWKEPRFAKSCRIVVMVALLVQRMRQLYGQFDLNGRVLQDEQARAKPQGDCSARAALM